MILTYYENIDLGSASVNISIVSQYHIIYTDLKVHNCIIFAVPTAIQNSRRCSLLICIVDEFENGENTNICTFLSLFLGII